jgi:hypothetical protein
VQALLPTEAYKSRVAQQAHGAAAACLLVSVFLAVAASRQDGWWNQNALFTLELGALSGFWLACLSWLLHRTAGALCLVWTTLLSGLIVALLLPRI